MDGPEYQILTYRYHGPVHARVNIVGVTADLQRQCYRPVSFKKTLKLRFQEFFLAGFHFFEISGKSCARGSIFVKNLTLFYRFPLVNGQKPDFFARNFEGGVLF